MLKYVIVALIALAAVGIMVWPLIRWSRRTQKSIDRIADAITPKIFDKYERLQVQDKHGRLIEPRTLLVTPKGETFLPRRPFGKRASMVATDELARAKDLDQELSLDRYTPSSSND
jgi:hypothetical protein